MTPAERLAWDAAADWIVSIGYPIDFRTEQIPPLPLRRAIERAWVRRDGSKPGDKWFNGRTMTAAERREEAISIRYAVREEGRWS